MNHPGEYKDDMALYVALLREQERTGAPVVEMPQYERPAAPVILLSPEPPIGRQQVDRAVWYFAADGDAHPSRTAIGTLLGQVWPVGTVASWGPPVQLHEERVA